MFRFLCVLTPLMCMSLPAFAETLFGGTVGTASEFNIFNPVTKHHRSASALRVFRARHPCPATVDARGNCEGYFIGYVTPPCAGGSVDPGNMKWQSVSDVKAKKEFERAQCSKKK